ncbi:unnamed protein product, partial [Cylicostephanus goldi]
MCAKFGRRASVTQVSSRLVPPVVAAPRLLFNTHFDVVPPFIPPSEDEEKVYGRGSSEAKGQLACMISAAQALAETRPEIAEQLALLFVVGEEIDH